MKLEFNFFKNKRGSFRILAGGIFFILAFLFLSSKGQFGRFSFWGSHGSADSSAPTCTIDTQPTLTNGWISTSHADYTFTCTDNVAISRVECNFNSTGWVTCNSNTAHSFTGLTNTASTSTNRIQIRAFDTSGNISATVSGTAFGVDVNGPSAPSLTLTGTDTSTFHVLVTATDVGNSGAVGYYYCSTDQGTPSYSFCISTDISNSLVGTVYFRIYAVDNAGNIGDAAVATWTNGGWTAWGTCSGTCAGGGGTQTRDCTNPAPSSSGLLGRNCIGSNSQSCNVGVSADNSANMCPGYRYFVKYGEPTCPPANPCTGSVTSTGSGFAGITLCNVPWTTGSVNCDGGTYYPIGTSFSCVSNLAHATYSAPCASTFKSNQYSVYECTCD